jgi:hypothetical protein
MFAPLAAATAVVAVIGAAVAVPNLVSGSGHHTPTTVTSPAAIGTAPFMVEVGASTNGELAVQQAGTNHVTALIPAPRGTSGWTSVAATGEMTFVASATTSSTSALYQVTLSSAGKLSQLTRLSYGIPGQIATLAASQGGDRIAYATLPGNGELNISGTATRRWTAPAGAGPGSTGLLGSTLSLTADGSELSFVTFRIADTVGPVRAAGTVWLLPSGSASGSATARGHKVTTGPHDSAPFSAVVSPDGQTMYVLSSPAPIPDSPGANGPESFTLSAYSTANGKLLRTVHTWTGIPNANTGEPSMTISGSQLLVWGIDGANAYQVDPVSGTTKPVWVYALHGKNATTASSTTIAW